MPSPLYVKIEWDDGKTPLTVEVLRIGLGYAFPSDPFRVTEYVPPRESDEIDRRAEEINLREAALEAEERGYKEGYREGQQDGEREA